MEKEKKGLLKSLISKTTSAVKKIPGTLKGVSDKVGEVMAAPGIALSNKIVKTIGERNNVGMNQLPLEKRQKTKFNINEPLKTSIPFPKTPSSLPLNASTSEPKWRPATPTELSTSRKLTPKEETARELLRKSRNTPPKR